MDICLKCGGTGVLINGEKCDCGCMDDFVLPTAMHIPSQYQNVRFEKSFLPKWLQNDYGEYMDKLLIDCTIHLHTFQKNILICAPPLVRLFLHILYMVYFMQKDKMCLVL